jgi:hypothetical protein
VIQVILKVHRLQGDLTDLLLDVTLPTVKLGRFRPAVRFANWREIVDAFKISVLSGIRLMLASVVAVAYCMPC